MSRAITCPSCAGPLTAAVPALLETPDGAIRKADVCKRCRREASPAALVRVDWATSSRMVLAPFVQHLRRIAKVYELNDDGRATGLRQAADILEEGRAVAPTLLEDVETVRPSPAAVPGVRGGSRGGRLEPGILYPTQARPPSTHDETPMDREIVRALAARGSPGMTRRQIAIATGYSSRGGAFASTMARLVNTGQVERRGAPGLYVATLAGMATAGAEPLPTGPALIAHWCEKLSAIEVAILNATTRAYPSEVPRDRMAEATGYEPQGGAFSKAIARLRALGLVERWRASDDLMRQAGAA
jgi:hypothetical protein